MPVTPKSRNLNAANSKRFTVLPSKVDNSIQSNLRWLPGIIWCLKHIIVNASAMAGDIELLFSMQVDRIFIHLVSREVGHSLFRCNIEDMHVTI